VFEVYFTGWVVFAVLGIFFGIAISNSTSITREKNMAKSLPFIGLVGGFVWPLAIFSAMMGLVLYGGWHTARAIKHRGWDY
jgi:hypothetical protein